jgi:beta-lactam-binding protein with PASTA domain
VAVRRRWLILTSGLLAAVVAGLGGYLLLSFVVERAPSVTVPDVTGLGISEAVDKLTAQSLDLEIRALAYSDEVPENRIVRQKPDAGKVVRAGRAVGVVLSRGAERHPVPDVRGLPLEDARIQLEEADLKAEVGVRMRDGAEGEVVAQGEEPGRRLARGSAVPLVVSSGPKPVLLRMPRLEGRTLDDAVAEADALGLRASRVEEVSLEDPSRQGRVVSHEPLAGFPVARGAEVTITVAAASRTVPTWREFWIVRTLPPGFGQRSVQVRIEGNGGSRVYLDESIGGGETFRALVPLLPGEVARLLVDGVEVQTFGGG